ncbi:MAG TPA: hypothetical protein VF701_04140 [Thermoanaerobaculia bacterium]
MFRAATVVVSLVTITLAATAALGQTAPPKVDKVSVTKGDMVVAGTPVTGAVSYAADAYVNGAKVAGATSTSSTVTIPASFLPPNTAVQVQMRALNSQGQTSAPSAAVAAMTGPAKTTGVTGTPGKNRISISWQPAAGAASYQVTLSNGMSFTTTSTSYVVTGLPTAASFNCIVWASNSAGQGPPSDVVVVKTANIMTLD